MLRPARLATLASIVLLAWAALADACSCARERTPTEALNVSAVVVEGTVIDRRAVLATVPEWPSVIDAAIEYVVVPTRVWKGSVIDRTPATGLAV